MRLNLPERHRVTQHASSQHSWMAPHFPQCLLSPTFQPDSSAPYLQNLTKSTPGVIHCLENCRELPATKEYTAQPRGQSSRHMTAVLEPSPIERHVKGREATGRVGQAGGRRGKGSRKVWGSLGTYMQSWRDELWGSEPTGVGKGSSP